MSFFGKSAQEMAELEEDVAKACRDEADFKKVIGEYDRAAVYDKAADKAEQRASVWRGLLG